MKGGELSVRSTLQELWRGDRGWILVVISVGWFFSLGGRMVYPVVLPQITAEFQIDYGTAGVVLSVLWIAYALMNIPAGLLADRIGEQLVLSGATLLASSGLILVLLAPTFEVFVVATVVFGLGCGMFGTTGTTILSDLYPARDTTAIGISQVAGSLGMIALPVIAGTLVLYAGWRIGIAHMLPGFLLLAVALWRIVPPRTSAEIGDGTDVGKQTRGRIFRVLGTRTMLLIIVAMGLIGFVVQGLTGFLPVFLIDYKGFAHWEASVVFGTFFVGSILGKLLSGPLADAYGKRITLVGFAAVSIPAILVLPMLDARPIVVLSVWISGVMMGYFPISMAYAVQFIPDDIQGSVFGIARTMFTLIGVLAPPIIGNLADRGQLDLGVFVLGGVVCVALIASIFLPALDQPPDS